MKKHELKILVIHPFFYPHVGGSEKYAEEMFTAIRKTHKEFKVDVLCYDTEKTGKYIEEYRDITIYRVSTFNLLRDQFALPNPFTLFLTLLKLKKNNYTFLNTHIRFFDTVWWGWFYAKVIGAKSIYTEHVSNHPKHKNIIVRSVAWFVDNTIADICVKKYDYFTAVNQISKNYLEQKLKSKKEVSLIRISIDTKKFYADDSNKQKPDILRYAKSTITTTSDTILITYLGRMIETKGVKMLFECIDPVLKLSRNLDVKFVFAGTGELEQLIETNRKKHPYRENIFTTGVLSYPEVSELLSRTNIFVNPSHHNEGLPTTLIEAGGSSCCVIATDNGGTNELIKNNETGYLIKQNDQDTLVRVLNEAILSKEKRVTLGQNLKKLVLQEYSLDLNSEKLYQFLTNL